MKRDIKDKICLFLATGFGIGFIVPFAPGTFGSIPGVALAYLVALLPVWAQILACAILTLLAVPICDRAEKLLCIKDDGRISADEWLLYPIALIGLPLFALPWWSMIIFFAVIRAIDILKPPPVGALQSIKGGLGITIDDFAANLYSLAINWAVYIYFFA